MDELANRSLGEDEVGRMYHHLQYVVGGTFRYTMLTAVCSYLEEALKAICRLACSSYDAEIGVPQKGSWLDKHVRLLQSHGVLFDPVNTYIATMKDMVIVRNCIVHAWGKVAEATDPTSVRAALGRHDYFDEFKDGFIAVDDEAAVRALEAAGEIVDFLMDHQFSVQIF